MLLISSNWVFSLPANRLDFPGVPLTEQVSRLKERKTLDSVSQAPHVHWEGGYNLPSTRVPDGGVSPPIGLHHGRVPRLLLHMDPLPPLPV